MDRLLKLLNTSLLAALKKDRELKIKNKTKNPNF